MVFSCGLIEHFSSFYYRMFAFITLIPIVETVLFCTTIGKDPQDLHIAVVNDELNFTDLCPPIKGCDYNLLSCQYLNSLKEYPMILVSMYPLLSECKIVVHGCEAWSFTLREERRLMVFENMILRQRCGPKRDANGEWRRLHNEKLHSLYHSPNVVRLIKSRRLRWAGHVARMEESRSAFKMLTGKPTERDLGEA